MNRIPTVRTVSTDDEHREVADALSAFVARHHDCAKGSPEAVHMRAQALILSDYEKQRWPIPKEWGDDWDPVDYIKDIAAERSIPQRELASCFGSQPNCSAVLNRRRGLTLPMIRKLHAKLGIPVEILIRAPKAAIRADRRATAAPYVESPAPALAVRDGDDENSSPAKTPRRKGKNG